MHFLTSLNVSVKFVTTKAKKTLAINFKLHNLSVHILDSFLYIRLHFCVILSNIASIVFKINEDFYVEDTKCYVNQDFIILHFILWFQNNYPKENFPPTSKLTLTQTLTLTRDQFFSGVIIWLPPNPKTKPGGNFPRGQLSGCLI